MTSSSTFTTQPLVRNSDQAMTVPNARAALVVAHPGHELRVYGWLEAARPRAFILTDGSGRSGKSRLNWTTDVLKRAGVEHGCVYGRMTDREVYDAVLKRDYDLFIGLVEELAGEFISEEIEYVAGDAPEGHNVAHEVCRLMIGAAAELASRRSGRWVANFDFTVVGRPDDCPEEARENALRISLNEDAFARKMSAVRSYHPKVIADVDSSLNGQIYHGFDRPSESELAMLKGDLSDLERFRPYPELTARFLGLLEGVQLDAFSEEILRPIDNRAGTNGLPEEPPFYEIYGEKLVEAGHYEHVIRYREHMVPLAEALWRRVERK